MNAAQRHEHAMNAPRLAEPQVTGPMNLAAFMAGAAWTRVKLRSWADRQALLASFDDSIAELVAFAEARGWYVAGWSDPDEVFNRRRA